jgi:hypothetical protein
VSYPSFDEWLEKTHPEIDATERKKLCDELEPNTPTEFWGKLSKEKLIEVESVGKSAELKDLVTEWVRSNEPLLREQCIEIYMARGLSREEAERELTKPRAVVDDPTVH